MCGLNTEEPVDLSRSGGALAGIPLRSVVRSASSVLYHAVLLLCCYRSTLDTVRWRNE
jgi:hypothetical protein